MKTILEYEHGLHRDVTEAVYHERVFGLASKHALDIVRKSPAHYRAWTRGKTQRETPALRFGKAFDAALLEPERFAETYVIEPEFGYLMKHDVSGTTAEQGKANKERKREWEAKHAGRLRLSADEHLASLSMADAIRRYPFAASLLSGECFSQVTLRWRDEETGIECKARPDLFNPEHGVIIDVKTAEDATEDGFVRASSMYGYHRQDAFYRDGMAAIGLPVEHFLFLVVEKEEPFFVNLFNHSAADVGRGRDSIASDLHKLSKAIETDNFKAHGDGIVTVNLRTWAA